MTFLAAQGSRPARALPAHRPPTTPVAPVQDREGRWLVAGFRPGGWARSGRAAGRVTLNRGRTTETFTATELGPAEAAPILKRYLAEHPRTGGAHFDVGKDAALADFAAEPPGIQCSASTPPAPEQNNRDEGSKLNMGVGVVRGQ
jgi:hypothetical protein